MSILLKSHVKSNFIYIVPVYPIILHDFLFDFSSPELKARMSFSDRLLSVVRPICINHRRPLFIRSTPILGLYTIATVYSIGVDLVNF